MKQFFPFLILLLLADTGWAQIKFVCTVDGLTGDHLLVEKPFNGNYFPAAPEKVYAGKKGRFIIESDGNEPGFVKIHLDENKVVRVFLEPGRTSSLEVDLDDFEKSLRFSGPQSSQNEFLQQLDRSAQPDDQLMEDPKSQYLSTLANIAAEKKLLKKKGKKRFSKAFLAAMKQDIEYYHASLYTGRIASEYQLYRVGRKSVFTPEWGDYWGKAYKVPDFSDPLSAVTEYYLKMLDHNISTYRLGYRQENEYIDPDLALGEQYIEYDRLLWEDLDGPLLEYSIAGLISYQVAMGGGEPILFDLFQKYKNDFPSGIYLPVFENVMQPIGGIPTENTFDLPPGIVNLDENEEINSLDELLSRFAGKVVYMDVWATWCSPCLFEFRQKKQLEEFVDGREIVLLFVSVDDSDRSEKWRNIIVENNLKGYHLMANYSLRDELIHQFGSEGGLVLPHYMIYDKSGKLVDGDAKQPSHNVLLLRDLEGVEVGN